jgi:hypothetical protein
LPILLPHDDAKHTGEAWITYVTRHITTIGEIERVTGIDFPARCDRFKTNSNGELQSGDPLGERMTLLCTQHSTNFRLTDSKLKRYGKFHDASVVVEGMNRGMNRHPNFALFTPVNSVIFV